MNRILVADEMHPSIHQLIESIGFECDYQPQLKRDEIIGHLAGATGLIIRSKTTVDAELLIKADQLKFVARAGAGVDKVVLSDLEDRNITLLNAPEGNRDALGEHAIGMILTLFNKISFADFEVRNRSWRREANRGVELKGKTVGIFGFGFMGSAFAQRLAGFDCRVVAFDKYKKDYTSHGVEEVDFEEFCELTEILSIHVPLTDETKMFFDREMLGRFARLQYIVNTARGEVLSLDALFEMLQAGQLKGAALDVIENEKLDRLTEHQDEIYQQLFDRKDVVLTPHVGGWTHESYRRINEVLVGKISALMR